MSIANECTELDMALGFCLQMVTALDVGIIGMAVALLFATM